MAPDKPSVVQTLRDFPEREREEALIEAALREREGQLLESEAKFRSAFSNAAIGFAMTDSAGRFLDANPAYCELTGYTKDELRQYSFSQLIHPDDVVENMALIHQMLEGHIPDFVIENRYLRKDGQTVWVRKSVSLARSAEGDPSWIIALVENIDERVKREQNTTFLMEIGQLLARLSTVDDILCLAGERTINHLGVSRLVFAELDEAKNELWNLYDSAGLAPVGAPEKQSLAEFIGPALLAELQTGHILVADDLTADPRYAQQAEAYRRQGVCSQVIVPSTREGRSSFVILLQRSAPYHWHEDEIELLAALAARVFPRIEQARVLDALRKSQQFVAGLVSTSFEGIWSVDATGKTSFANQRAAEILGYTLDEIVGQKAMDFLMPQDVEAGQQTLARVVTGERGKTEAHVRHKNGHELWLLVAFSPIQDEQGQFQGALAMFNDITERKYAEIARQAAAERDAFRVLLSDVLRPLSDPSEIQEKASRLLGEFLGADRVFYLEVEGNDEHFLAERDYCQPGIPSIVGRYLIRDYGLFLMRELYAGHTLAIADIQAESDLTALERAAYAAVKARAWIAVPLIKGGRYTANLVVHQTRPRVWTVDEINLTEEVAERTWAAVERARAEAHLRESEQRFRSSIEGLNEAFSIFSAVRQDGVIVDFRTEYSNGIACKMLNRAPEKVIGRSLLELIPENETNGMFERYVRVVETGQPLQMQAGYSGTVRNERTQPRAQLRGVFDIRASKFGDGLIVTGNDISEQIRLQAENQQAIQQSEVHHRLAEQREMERQSYARDIHDGPIQSLSGLGFTLQYLKEIYPDAALGIELDKVAQSVKSAIQELRDVINELRPPSVIRFGLSKAIQSHAEYLRERYPQIHWSLNLAEETRILPEQTCLAMFRIYQEAINNIIRHSEATRARVRYQVTNDEAILEIIDNGCGFSQDYDVAHLTSNKHFGLAGIFERVEAIGGRLAIKTRPGKGTTITVRIPV